MKLTLVALLLLVAFQGEAAKTKKDKRPQIYKTSDVFGVAFHTSNLLLLIHYPFGVLHPFAFPQGICGHIGSKGGGGAAP